MVCHVHWFLADFGVPFSITATTWLALVFAPLYSKVHFWNVHMADHEERLHNVGTVLRTVSANASATVRKVAISTLSAHKSAFVGNPSWLDWSLTGIWRQSLHSYVCWSVYTLVHSHCLAQTRRSNCHFRIFAWLGLRLWGPTQVCHWLSENLLEQRLAGAYEVPWHVSFQIQSLSSSSKCTNRTVQFNVKNALKSQLNAANWAHKLPMVILALRTLYREKCDASAAVMLYGMNLRLPNQFYPTSTACSDNPRAALLRHP